MAEYFSTNLKYLREKKGLSQNKLGNIIGVNQTTIARWEDDNRIPTIDNAIDVAEALQIPLPDLLGKDLRINNIDSNLKPIMLDRDVVKIPVLGRIPAGMPFEAIEDTYTIDYEEIPRKWLNGGKKYFALKLDGDSMEPDFKNGDVVVFLKTPACESGQYCCVKVNGFDATFKQVKILENGIFLEALNKNNSTNFTDTFYTKEEIQSLPVEIIGVAKRHIGDL